jgi:predicted dehydrogenase
LWHHLWHPIAGGFFVPKSSASRRNFLKLAGAGVAGTALSAAASSYAKIAGANDRVGVGIIGFSDRFRNSLAPAFLKSAGELNFEFVALSDIWSKRRDDGGAFVSRLPGGRQIVLARNNEELYENKDVQAVIIATPDFQHAAQGVEALRAGRDAYIEKPLANTMEDARAIRAAAKGTDRVVAIGTQRRSSPIYQRIHDYMKSGAFGDVVSVDLTWNVNQPGRWRRPRVVSQLRESDTDWKRFLAGRPPEPFDARKYVEFRLFWPYSSGIPDQWMVHRIDTVQWFTGLARPRSVVANGGIYHWHDGRKNWDTLTTVFDYGPMDEGVAGTTKGFQVVYSARMTNSAGGVREHYFSNGGMLDLEKGMVTPAGGLIEEYAREMDMKANQLTPITFAAPGSDELAEHTSVAGAERAERKSPTAERTTGSGSSGASTAAGIATGAVSPLGENTGPDEATVANLRNWMECVQERKRPNADIEAGYNHSVALCMTIAAMQTGQRVTFDDVKQEVVIGAPGGHVHFQRSGSRPDVPGSREP